VPDGIAATPDGRFAFVALQSGPPRIAVIARVGVGARLLRTIPIPAHASGIRVTADGRYVLAAAGRGAVVLDAAAATSGATGATAARGVVLGSLAAPARVAGAGPGAAEVAISPDSRYAFVTLEGAGVVAVFDLRRGFGSGAYLGAMRVGAGALGIAASEDGRWLYEVSESGRSSISRRRGVLNVIDATRAVRTPRSAVVAAAPAPCAPVRVAVAPDGATIWVTARDGNQLLGYSASVLRTDAARALISATTVGSAPLGLAVADDGRTVLIADSNLAHSVGGRSAVSSVDVSAVGHPVLTGSIPAGTLADAIAAPSAGGVAFATSSASHTVAVVPLSRLR
jgi:DNA-binding beta-propeller fold protein YncE